LVFWVDTGSQAGGGGGLAGEGWRQGRVVCVGGRKNEGGKKTEAGGEKIEKRTIELISTSRTGCNQACTHNYTHLAIKIRACLYTVHTPGH